MEAVSKISTDSKMLEGTLCNVVGMMVENGADPEPLVPFFLPVLLSALSSCVTVSLQSSSSSSFFSQFAERSSKMKRRKNKMKRTCSSSSKCFFLLHKPFWEDLQLEERIHLHLFLLVFDRNTFQYDKRKSSDDGSCWYCPFPSSSSSSSSSCFTVIQRSFDG